jgi:hypothetical protein
MAPWTELQLIGHNISLLIGPPLLGAILGWYIYAWRRKHETKRQSRAEE